MLEKYNIQTRGFHNVYDEDGNAIGFQLCFRSTYYKGVWLSQVRVGDIIVDGEVFGRDKQTWIINDVDYDPDEMEKISTIHWHILDVATIFVKKPGGLSQGYHDVAVNFGTVGSYTPPMFAIPPKDKSEWDKPYDMEVFSMLATRKFEKRMIIV